MCGEANREATSKGTHKTDQTKHKQEQEETQNSTLDKYLLGHLQN